MLRVETLIQAPLEACFDAARDMGLHCESARQTGERIVAGKSSGLLELGDEIVFEGTHFGVRQRLGSRITAMDPPAMFVDEMTQGVFASLCHTHEFASRDQGTLMVDILEWRSPLGILGRIADVLFVSRHMERFMHQRNSFLKSHLEPGAGAARSVATP